MNLAKTNYKILVLKARPSVSVGIEGHAEVRGPKRFVDTRKVQAHLSEMFHGVVTWSEAQVSHFT